MRERKNDLDGQAVALLLACCLFWGFQQVLIKGIVAEVPPMWQASIRFAVSTAMLWLWCRWRGIDLLARDGTLWPGLLSGLLFTLEFVGIYLGLRDTTASRLTVFLYTSPFVVAALLPRLVPSERLRPLQWVGLVVAFAAVVMAFSEGLSGSGRPGQWRGDALGLMAGLAWGCTTLVLRASAVGRVSAEKALFYQVGVTAVLAPLISLAMGEPWSLRYSGSAWTSLALQAAVGSFASYLAWMWLLRWYPATRVASFGFLTPVFALMFGVALLAEPLTPGLVLALAGVAVGIVLVNRRR